MLANGPRRRVGPRPLRWPGGLGAQRPAPSTEHARSHREAGPAAGTRPRPLPENQHECAGSRSAGPVPSAPRRTVTPPPPAGPTRGGVPAGPNPAAGLASGRAGRERHRRGERARAAGKAPGPSRRPTWLQVMNSLVWASSTSVHSLLRKAGTLELCFIVHRRGARVFAAERGGGGDGSGGGGSGGGGSDGESSCSPRTSTAQAQQPASPAPSAPPGAQWLHVTDKSVRLRACWTRASPACGQSQALIAAWRNAIGGRRRGGAGAEGGAACPLAFSGRALVARELGPRRRCLAASRGGRFVFRGRGRKAAERPQGFPSLCYVKCDLHQTGGSSKSRVALGSRCAGPP